MSREIFLIQNDGHLIEMRENEYDSEKLLQDLLIRYPHLLVGSQIDPVQPRRWLLLSREASLPSKEGGGGRWAVDHLFLDQDAVPTLVEVKRSTDTRIRREVVGQMLDYAANAVAYWPVEALQTKFEARCQERGVDPDEELHDFLESEQDAVQFWKRVKLNLQAGKVRLLFVADEIPAELRRIVEFLNEQMDPAEVLAIEIKQYKGAGLSTLVPTIVGQTAEAQQRKSTVTTEKNQWDESGFFQTLQQRHTAAEVNAARQILEWAQSHVTYVWWGKGQQMGSFVPTFQHGNFKHQLFAVYTYGTVELYFQWYQNKPVFDTESKRIELAQRLNSIDDVSVPLDAIHRRPGIPLSALKREEDVTRFLEIYEWFIQEVQSV